LLGLPRLPHRRRGRKHYEAIAKSTTHERPLARDFYAFFAGQQTTVAQGWRRLERLDDIMPGDTMAWELPVARTGDTGHCFVVAKSPVPVDDGSVSVEVYDSTSILHFDDSRGDGPGQFATGVGSGSIHFKVDDAGAPISFRFDPRASFKDVPIAIARIEPFSAS
jgi:hypothetical protein